MLSLVRPVALLAQTEGDLAHSFSDLGNLLLGGVLVAIGAALVIAFVRIKLQSRSESASSLASINPAKYKDEG